MGNICWLASYPKSGNTWIRAFLANYFSNQSTPVDINALHELSQSEASAFRYQHHVEGGDTTALDAEAICAIRPLVQAEMAQQAHGTAFVKTHNFLGEYKGYPLHNSAVTSAAVYVLRNPLDVAISVANYFALTLDEAIDFMAEEMTGTPSEEHNVPQIISSWSNHVQSWTGQADPSILVLKYEDLLDKPQKAFRKVVSHLGQPRDDKRLKRAIQFCSFAQMKQQERKGGFVERHENARSFFRSGRKNQWLQTLSDEQVARLVEDHREQMERFNYLPPKFR